MRMSVSYRLHSDCVCGVEIWIVGRPMCRRLVLLWHCSIAVVPEHSLLTQAHMQTRRHTHTHKRNVNGTLYHFILRASNGEIYFAQTSLKCRPHLWQYFAFFQSWVSVCGMMYWKEMEIKYNYELIGRPLKLQIDKMVKHYHVASSVVYVRLWTRRAYARLVCTMLRLSVYLILLNGSCLLSMMSNGEIWRVMPPRTTIYRHWWWCYRTDLR